MWNLHQLLTQPHEPRGLPDALSWLWKHMRVRAWYSYRAVHIKQSRYHPILQRRLRLPLYRQTIRAVTNSRRTTTTCVECGKRDGGRELVPVGRVCGRYVCGRVIRVTSRSRRGGAQSCRSFGAGLTRATAGVASSFYIRTRTFELVQTTEGTASSDASNDTATDRAAASDSVYLGGTRARMGSERPTARGWLRASVRQLVTSQTDGAETEETLLGAHHHQRGRLRTRFISRLLHTQTWCGIAGVY